ncbi:hypothetical protein PGT21_021083 [Puccinia graminis f. sp. tritici]|uniref:Uncharacterized protein n=1 Tax=Puccinia graminis f. sp. tritici TaxID=56615 RepID=A0A5B0QFZ3_PUCGR|nr:hypothetical protein PGT21_021083 [Puccinia graminis f. sp. tritici]KAA1112130.1 hypothetical protein PGTUg99_005647 [Puccinia graminis f. sp. tritici]
MAFNTEWIPGATFSGRADFVNAIPTANPMPSSNADATHSSDSDSFASDDESNLANDTEVNFVDEEVAVVNQPNTVVDASTESPPAYRLAALPLGSPENPIEIADDKVANQPENNEGITDYERLNSPRFDPVEIIPFQATVVDEEDVLRARERINRWFNNHIRHNSQRVLRGRSRRARAAAGPVEPYWTVNELMDSVLEELDDILNNASRVELIHV